MSEGFHILPLSICLSLFLTIRQTLARPTQRRHGKSISEVWS